MKTCIYSKGHEAADADVYLQTDKMRLGPYCGQHAKLILRAAEKHTPEEHPRLVAA